MFKTKNLLPLRHALCLLLSLLLLVSCTPAQVSPDMPQDDPVEYFTLDATAYAIVPEADVEDENISAAIKLLSNACEKLTGAPIKTADDWYRDELVRYDVEILIGSTNRPESAAAADLKYHDYFYEVVSTGVVAIYGGSTEATLAAVEQFLKDCYGYEQGVSAGETKDIPVGTSLNYEYSYRVDELTICGEDIESFTIVHNDNATGRTISSQLRQDIRITCGIDLSTTKRNDYKGGNAIFLGMATPEGKHADLDYGESSFSVNCEESNGDTHLFVDSTVSYVKIVEAFSRLFLKSARGETLDLSFDNEIFSSHLKDADNELTLDSTLESETLATGVTYRKLCYEDFRGRPVIAYVLEADLSAVSVVNATPNNDYAFGDGLKATTEAAMQKLIDAGVPVIAGVNADFFDMKGTGAPRGLCIKNGNVMLGARNRPWFGITTDGKPVIGEAKEYASNYEGRLVEAVGGSAILLRDGEYMNLELDSDGYYSEGSYTRHPRTCVGITEDGKLLLVVVDGRSDESNGASFLDLADIMLGLGAVDALNLDGGGSSTIVTAKDGALTTRNVPSDGELRPVYNSLVLIPR